MAVDKRAERLEEAKHMVTRTRELCRESERRIAVSKRLLDTAQQLVDEARHLMDPEELTPAKMTTALLAEEVSDGAGGSPRPGN
jgi:hypothetical protein